MSSICSLCGNDISNIIQYTLILPEHGESVISCGRCYVLCSINDRLEEIKGEIQDGYDR